MTKDTFFITGTGSCGTTFLARLMYELGFDLGPEGMLNTPLDARRGMEWLPMAQLVTDLEILYSPIPLPPFGTEFELPERVATMRDFMEAVTGMELPLARMPIAAMSSSIPDVVKAPALSRWLGTWLRLGGRRPTAVIICFRPIGQAALSFARDKVPVDLFTLVSWLYLSHGILMETLKRESLPTFVVDFPKMVNDPGYLYRSLPLLQHIAPETFLAAHNKIAKPEEIHV